ncbi:MAG: hypothetical protein HPY76_00960 [Anaerolineae bacterium]|nr:hypothetical protein [Anaerolineae bacterium]
MTATNLTPAFKEGSMQTHQARIRLQQALPTGEPPIAGQPGGAFEILAITAGEGNGWHFPAAVLQESLPLWQGAECFIDHAWRGHSLRDLAGVLTEVHYDPQAQGIQAHLQPFGPAAALLEEMGRAMLNAPVAPAVGFSADILFSAEGQRVARILRVFSVDLVIDPARGGTFMRALNSQWAGSPPALRKENTMPHETPTQSPDPGALQQAVNAELESAQSLRQQLCASLLESALAVSNLPAPAANQVRQRFSGRAFDPADLNSAIEETRDLVSALTAGAVVQGPGRLSAMHSSEEQFTSAVHDLLGAPRPQGLEGVQPHRLGGIRELYTLMTGDIEFRGTLDPQRALFATPNTSANLPGVLKNALNKLVLLHWEELGRAGYRWWEPVVQVEHFNSLQALTGVLVGEVTVLPTIAEGAAYTELEVSDSPETAAWTKYGGYIGLTLEMFERDETHKLRQYPRKLASAGLRRISSLVSAVFTANGAVGPVMADTYNVFDASHHANLGTAALSGAAWEAASQAIYEQPMVVAAGGEAPVLALDARYLLVPRELRLTAMRILYPTWEREANIVSENLQRGQFGDVITVPEWSDANNWAAVADPRLAPGIILAERFGVMPEVFIADNELNGALFTNDQLRIKARHWLAVLVADHRPLYKANVA